MVPCHVPNVKAAVVHNGNDSGVLSFQVIASRLLFVGKVS